MRMIHNGGGFFQDYIQNRILLIHNPKRFFTTDPEKSEYSQR